VPTVLDMLVNIPARLSSREPEYFSVEARYGANG